VLQHSVLAGARTKTTISIGPFQFRVRDPLDVDALQISVPGRVLTAERIRTQMRPLNHLPRNPERVRSVDGLRDRARLGMFEPRAAVPRRKLRVAGVNLRRRGDLHVAQRVRDPSDGHSVGRRDAEVL